MLMVRLSEVLEDRRKAFDEWILKIVKLDSGSEN